MPRRVLRFVGLVVLEFESVCSSYQFDCLVASFVDSIWPDRSAVNFVGSRSSAGSLDVSAKLVAVIRTDLRCRLMLRCPSSEE